MSLLMSQRRQLCIVVSHDSNIMREESGRVCAVAQLHMIAGFVGTRGKQNWVWLTRWNSRIVLGQPWLQMSDGRYLCV
jgi:predicted ATPase